LSKCSNSQNWDRFFDFHFLSSKNKHVVLFNKNCEQPAQLVAVAGIGHGLQQFPFELVHRGVPLLTEVGGVDGCDAGHKLNPPTIQTLQLPNTT